ncbi:MAG: hypothetical protein KY391_08365, partial [Actinobacteria bacterium]|nr:hypothetical protein [Actinomycetota bacterium]
MLITVVCLALISSSCTSVGEADSNDRPTPETTPHSIPGSVGTGKASKGQPFDRLTMSLELRSNEVVTGGRIPSTVSVKNETQRPVVDPGCALYAYSYALVPVDQPDAELWGQVIVDCAGSRVLKAGYIDRYKGPTFAATDKFGEPLPVGEYLAVMELQERS